MKKEAKHYNALRRKEIISAWLFLIPILTGFVLFLFYPLVKAIYISFCDYDLFNPPKFLGFGNMFDNYREIFYNAKTGLGDEWFWQGMKNVLVYSLGVPVGMVIALILSAMIKNMSKGSLFFRIVFYVPTICSAVAITFIWKWIYAKDFGVLFKLITAFGGVAPDFLSDGHIMTSVMIMGVWGGLGVSILLFFATLHGIPESLYEAAELDGANGFKKFMHITVPSITPVIFYILLTGIIGSMQVFSQLQVMKNNTMSKASTTPVWYIYRYTSGTYGLRYGYATAMGVLLGLIIIGISAIQFIVSKLWVNND